MGLELAGKTFGGYRVGDVLDSGPQGVLYAAEHTASGDKVALKIYAADLARDKSLAARVVADVQRAVAVTHPNLAVVREVGTAEYKGKRHLFVAMERLPGESLKSLLSKQKGQPLPLTRALHLGSEIAAALEAIHRSNQVHRLLQPGAVFVAPGDGDRDEERVVLLDLGASAVPASDDKKAKPGGKVQDDLRALALLLSAMLEGGEGSFDSSQAVLPLRLRNPAVPSRIDAVLRSVINDSLGSGDKAARYDSAAALAAALLGTGETQPSYASWSADGRTRPPTRKSGGTLLWAGIVAVAGGLALGYFLFPSDTPPSGPGPQTGPDRPPIVDRASNNPPPSTSVDAGIDAAAAIHAPGPGHWPARPGSAIPPVRPADEWPPTPAPAAPTGPVPPAAKPVPPVGTPAAASPAVPIGQPVGAGPNVLTAPKNPAVPAATPTPAPAAAPPAAGGAKPGVAPGSPTAPVSPAAKPPAAPVAAPSAGMPAAAVAKPAAVPGASAPGATNQGAAQPAAKPITPTPVSGPSASAGAAKPAASPTGGTAPGTMAKPTPAAPTTPSPAGGVTPAAGSKPVGSVGPAASPPPASKTPVTAPTAPATGAKPATAPAAATGTAPAKPAAPAATGAAAPNRSPSAPAAPAGAVPAAKNPEPRPSSPGAVAPAAKPATTPSGANGPQ